MKKKSKKPSRTTKNSCTIFDEPRYKIKDMKNFTLIIALFASANLFAQDKPIEPTKTEAALTVFVTDLKDKPREGEVITFTSLKTKKEYSGVTKKDGKFYILV